MSTLLQLIKHPRIAKKRAQSVPALQRCPQKKGVCVKLYIKTPKKPNSARRKVALLRLSNKKRIYAYIPGEGKHTLQEHSVVLVRGGHVKDLIGMKYKLIRGVYDFEAVLSRKNARSKYGAKRIKTKT
jgi:small subunit ribosomal protein S12